MNYRNLQILTDFFESVQVDRNHPVYCPEGVPTVNFHMGTFTTSHFEPSSINRAPCGTSCCFIGHGPLAGLAPSPESVAPNDWMVYSYEVMGLDPTKDEDHLKWVWLFDTMWVSDPHMAVRRARYLLAGNPVPDRDTMTEAQDDARFLHHILKEGGV